MRQLQAMRDKRSVRRDRLHKNAMECDTAGTPPSHPAQRKGKMTTMLIRPYIPGEELLLRAVFHSSVHGLARRDYTVEQLHAWAPAEYDAELWCQRMLVNQTLVAELDGQPAAFTDLQPSGYVDMFFVAAPYAGRGVGSALLQYVFSAAAERGIGELYSDVSLTAEPFFTRHGFTVDSRNKVEVRGVLLDNASMRKRLK